MTSPQVNTLLIDAPVGRHFAQLHRDPKTLVDSVGLFIETGLRRGNSVVVIATPANTEKFLNRLSKNNLQAETYLKSGQLTVLYAETALNQFMHNGMPDWEEFRKTVGTVIDGAKTFGKSVVRAYGEMVNILWREGNTQAAIRLEEYWNELARLHPFSLFCGYMLDSHKGDHHTGPLHEICRTHSDIIGTQDDEVFQKALDAASKDIFGTSLPEMIISDLEDKSEEHRLPSIHRSILWIMRNKTASSGQVLELARRYYQDLASEQPKQQVLNIKK